MRITLHGKRWTAALFACVAAAALLSGSRVSGHRAASAPETLRQYCAGCHGLTGAKAGLSIERLLGSNSFGDSFRQWEKIAAALEQKTMPPKAMPQPSDEERAQAVAWIRAELKTAIEKNAGDPGRVTVRRLTSGEYAYTMQDLTGLDLDLGIDAASDSVGGEGFTNFGDVQFMQSANLERYLNAARIVADHAVIGAGPLEFFPHPGKTGFELAAITRIKDIYATHGIRTVSGEGGRPFGLERYAKAFFAAWQYRHRGALGEPALTLKELAAREGLPARFTQHVWDALNRPSPGYPLSEIIDRWRKLPAPSADREACFAATRTACAEIQKFSVTWPSWLFARGDVAAGGAGDESPLEFNDRSLNVEPTHKFIYVRRVPPGAAAAAAAAKPGTVKIYLHVAVVNPAAGEKPVVIWRNATVGFRAPESDAAAVKRDLTPEQEQQVLTANLRRGLPPPGPRAKLRDIVSPETAQRLQFGKSPDGSPVGPDDFASEGMVMFEVPAPQNPKFPLNLQIEAVLGRNRDQVVRLVIADREDLKTRGAPTKSLLGDMTSAGYKTFRAGVMEYAALLPPNTHGEPTPADKDPIPDPFDNTYNVPEHDDFVQKVKYLRDDRFLVENLIDPPTRKRLDQAWTDLYTSFGYHDNYLRLLAEHYNYDLQGAGMEQMTRARTAGLPAEMRKYVLPLRAQYEAAVAAEAAARPRHLTEALDFAARAWRRPLTEAETQGLRAFYQKMLAEDPDHRRAIRAVLARVLVAPQFLYRVELSALTAPVRPLTNWEMASRLGYFLWSSIPDDELRRAAAAGELTDPQGIERQVRRMAADPKARRLSAEFFGQWLGFYRFDHYKGVDTGRFTEFTDGVKSAMYDEAVSFFEHIIRKDRPIRELFSADYTFLNKELANYYGVKKEIKSADRVEYVEGATAFHRGGLLRLGAVLTATSAPLRTSPVKRGDWILRRIIGTPVPPPPADAGSIPADDKLFGGLTVKARLDQHKRNATCANCHLRIDPLGFSLERFDSTGRWRDRYPDGKPIEDSGTLTDKTEIAGYDGLLRYLRGKEPEVNRNLASKLVGYALGRTVLASDQPLIDRMIAGNGEATFTRMAAEIALSKQFRNHLGRDESPAASKVAVNRESR